MDVRTGEIVVNDEKLMPALMTRSNRKNLPFNLAPPPDDFEKQIEMGYIVPLARLPRRSCGKCFGRGHVGKNVQTRLYIPCRCTL